MTREAGLCCGLSVLTPSRLPPGCHDASCTLVVKLSSATRLSLLAGQPKPIRAVLLTWVCGTAVRRPLAMDTTSSCTASSPSSESSLTLTWTARNLPSGLKAALAAALAAGSSTDTCRPVARFSTCTPQRAAHGGAQAISVALAAITAARLPLGCVADGSHTLPGIVPDSWGT